ncbi:hypothetical protein FD04_GL001824 [Secundilactobacillus odoratitofui DSM 19909 = JCM 15043]|uniref:Uncharacterized protein n=1 Tax=Secundilactobacillus odoratitofui DSM 19909 = JCM 15043 TaxID=1423776 RepID=A0A0R1LN68_9LACO|nr:hypothetical protein [Secundilactobacillus odoratitofui]KRK96968.1 hypothetical protein FD04_GL001824 [Secundilactobacillus odoratitofui DSM 19909 = JCM 15043]
MPSQPKKSVKHSMPEINVKVKTPPSSGGLMDWGPLFGWATSWFKSLFKKHR